MSDTNRATTDSLVMTIARVIDVEGYGEPYGDSATGDSIFIASAILDAIEPVFRQRERAARRETLKQLADKAFAAAKRKQARSIANTLRGVVDLKTFSTEQFDGYFTAIEIVESIVDALDADTPVPASTPARDDREKALERFQRDLGPDAASFFEDYLTESTDTPAPASTPARGDSNE